MPPKKPSYYDSPINLFPGIYFFIPCLREQKRRVGSKEIIFDEPMDAMLWFLDAIPALTGQRSYPKADLKKLIIRWFGTDSTRNFERLYKQLRDKKFIHSEQNPANRRAHNVELTGAGRRLLDQVKEERVEHIGLVRKELLALSAADRRVILRWLHKVSTAGMVQMIQEVGGEALLAGVPSRQRTGTSRKK